MEQGFIRRTYTKYLLTSMLAILGSVAGQVVNNMLVGNILGVAALSVTGIALPVHYIFATLGALFGIGGMTLCAHLIGKSKRQELHEAFTQVYLLTVLAGVGVSAVLLLNLDGVAVLLGAPPELAGEVRQYAAVTAWCGVFNMGIYPAFHLLRLDGRTWTAVGVFGVMAGVTVGLDVLLLVALRMGLLGAALAYGGGLAAASVMGALLLFFKSKNFKLAKLDKRALGMIPEILKTGSPSAMENLCILLKVLALNLIVVGFGVAALSAYNVTNSVLSFAFIFVAGVSGSIMPFAGVLYTERDVASAKQLVKIAFSRGLWMIALFSAACILFAPRVAGLFGMSGQAELAYAVPAVMLVAASLPPFMVNSILICLYQSTGRALMANVLTALRGFVLVAAFAWLLSGPFGVMGVWNSFWISDALTLAVAIVWAAALRRQNPMLSRLTLLDERVEKEGRYIAFSVRPENAAIARAAEKVTEFCEANDLSVKRTTALSLALEEFLLLIAARNEKDPDIDVRLLALHDVAVLRIRDTGVVFDPVEAYRESRAGEASGAEQLEAAQDSLGIRLVLGMAQTVDYRQTFGANNLTILM